MQRVRFKLFWVIALAAISLALTTLLFTHVTHFEVDDWGLLSKLPVIFWVGLLSLGLLLYPAQKHKNRMICLSVLFILFLFWVPQLIKDYGAEFHHAYYFSSEAKLLTSKGHLVTNPNDPLIRYQNWPFFLYLEAIMIEVMGMPPLILTDLFQLINIGLFALLAFLIFRLKLGTTNSLFAVIWFLTGFWMGQNYFSPQSMSYVLYLMVFFLIVKQLYYTTQIKGRTIRLLVFFLFSTTVFSHQLTPIVIISALVAISLFKTLSRRFSTQVSSTVTLATCALFITIQATYMIYIAYPVLDVIGQILRERIFLSEISPALTWASRTFTFGSTYEIISALSSRAIVTINLIFFAFGVSARFFGRKARKTRSNNLFWIAWIGGVGFFGLFASYGIEPHIRAYMFALVPLSYINISFLIKKPKILCTVLLILLFFHFPAHYSKDSWYAVTSTEMAGTKFFAEKTPQSALYYYTQESPTLWYQDPTRVATIGYIMYDPQKFYAGSFNASLFREETQDADYFLLSSSQKNFFFYYFGSYPFEKLHLDVYNNRLYNNERFLIYGKIKD